MTDYRYLELAKEVLHELRSSDDLLPKIVRDRQKDPKNCFLHYIFVRKIGEGAMATVWHVGSVLSDLLGLGIHRRFIPVLLDAISPIDCFTPF